jgi:protein TonB
MQVRAVEIVVSRDGVKGRRPADNVVPFHRPDLTRTAPIIAIDHVARAARSPRARFTGVSPAVFLVASLMLHAGVFAAFQRQAPPLASVGVQSISVEIVLGGDQAAGTARVPVQAESTLDSIASRGESSELVKPETAREETKVAEAATPVEPLRDVREVTEAKPVPRQEAREDAAVAATPPESQTVPPQAAIAELQASTPAETQPVEPTSQMQAVAEPPQEAVAPPVSRAVAAPPRKRPAVAQKQKKHRGEDSRTRESTNSSSSVASSGIGRGRSDATSNYKGLVQARLMRNLYYPPDAKRAGHQGVATVSFLISASGAVSGITLIRGTGIPSLDHEAVAVVSRSAPFPAPADPRGYRPTVPVIFHIR